MEIDPDGGPRLFWIIKYQDKHDNSNTNVFFGEVLLLGFFCQGSSVRVLLLGFFC